MLSTKQCAKDMGMLRFLGLFFMAARIGEYPDLGLSKVLQYLIHMRVLV
jgi:hypothetical protein